MLGQLCVTLYHLPFSLGQQPDTISAFRVPDHLVGLMVKLSTLRVEGPGFESCLRQDFSRSRHTSDLKMCTPVATLPCACRYRVSAGTGSLVSVYCDWVRQKV